MAQYTTLIIRTSPLRHTTLTAFAIIHLRLTDLHRQLDMYSEI